MDLREYLVSKPDGSHETIETTYVEVGKGGELILMGYTEYKEGSTFSGPFLQRIIAAGQWLDLVLVKEIKSEQVPKGPSVRIYDSKDSGEGGVRDLT